MKKIIFIFALLVIAVGAYAAKTKTEKLKGEAPDFTLKSNQGKNIRLSDLRGSFVMINFWAHNCGPCKQEMPELEKLHQRYKDSGFVLLGVNVDKSQADADKLLRKIPVSYPILYDNTKKVARQYKVDTMPSTYMVDCDGNLTVLHRGYTVGEAKDYKKYIKELMRSCI